MEVIRLLPEGLTNTQIGARLFLTEAAIKSRVASALSQSGTKTRTHLAALAIVHRII